MRGILTKPRRRIWGRFGFAFCEGQNWYARSYLAINQRPIVIMIEDFRSGLLWRFSWVPLRSRPDCPSWDWQAPRPHHRALECACLGRLID
ncbi:glucoamylase family protein [Chelatococcus asaccharovorans]|uniref:glucoamylase family protein n=1 Tax=Chelatococcus asaccharovorans TaxID=28210 RepID=UPI002B274798|nr:glucoamylase family protein [Chelatococcus asaccharovorans]